MTRYKLTGFANSNVTAIKSELGEWVEAEEALAIEVERNAFRNENKKLNTTVELAIYLIQRELKVSTVIYPDASKYILNRLMKERELSPNYVEFNRHTEEELRAELEKAKNEIANMTKWREDWDKLEIGTLIMIREPFRNSPEGIEYSYDCVVTRRLYKNESRFNKREFRILPK